MNVLDAAYHVAHDYPGGAQALAVRMDKSPKTLCNELKAEGSAKFGLVDAVKVSHFAKSTLIAQAFCRELGGVFLRLPDATTTASMEEVGLVVKDFGDWLSEWTGDLSDGNVTANELRAIEQKALAVVATMTALVGKARAIHEAGKPPHLREVRS